VSNTYNTKGELTHKCNGSQVNNKQGKGSVTPWPSHFTLKSILQQEKNYENSNISPCKNIIFKKILLKNQNPSRYYNSITNLKFQPKPKYHLSDLIKE
jgi:hypothetical protein